VPCGTEAALRHLRHLDDPDRLIEIETRDLLEERRLTRIGG
jgi:hypothetical protein